MNQFAVEQMERRVGNQSPEAIDRLRNSELVHLTDEEDAANKNRG